MQASKKKAKPLNQIKVLQLEHLSKLQTKQLLETELLDDVRNFCKSRALIEKEYGQNLQKLTNSYLAKRELLGISSGEDGTRSLWFVWRRILEQALTTAQTRLKAAETELQMSEQLKPLRSARMAASKRICDQLKSLQFELMECLQEMVKAHKIYTEEEKQAHDARNKAKDADEKVRKRSTNIFNSMAHLHKNSAKLSTRRTACENRSTTSRNEYLFQLAAINAHLQHYFEVDVPDLAKSLDGEVYEKMTQVFADLTNHDLESYSGGEKDDAIKVINEAMQITRENAWQQFIKDNPSFGETIQYQFVPTEGDTVTLLYPPSEKQDTLINVSRKLVKRLVLREKKILDYEKELASIHAGKFTIPSLQQQQRDREREYDNVSQSPSSPATSEDMIAYNQEYMEHKIEDLTYTIRRGQIEMVKIKSCLELLKESGVDVSTMLTETYAAMAAATRHKDIDSVSQTTSQISGATNEEAELEAEDAAHRENYERVLRRNREGEGSSASDSPKLNRQILRCSLWAMEQSLEGSATNSPSHGTSEDISELTDDDPLAASSSTVGDRQSLAERNCKRAEVLYEFRATRPDEMDIVVGETLIVLGSGESEGWTLVRSELDGRQGLVPTSFIKITDPNHQVGNTGTNDVEEDDDEAFHTYINWGPKETSSSVGGPGPGSGSGSGAGNKPGLHLPSTSGSSGVAGRSAKDEVVSQHWHAYVNWRSDELDEMRRKRKENRRACLDPLKAAAARSNDADDLVRALVPFVGTGDDELTLSAGQLVRVLGRRPADGVDDGWWEGELITAESLSQLTNHPKGPGPWLGGELGKRGFFPSMIVESMRGRRRRISGAGTAAAAIGSVCLESGGGVGTSTGGMLPGLSVLAGNNTMMGGNSPSKCSSNDSGVNLTCAFSPTNRPGAPDFTPPPPPGAKEISPPPTGIVWPVVSPTKSTGTSTELGSGSDVTVSTPKHSMVDRQVSAMTLIGEQISVVEAGGTERVSLDSDDMSNELLKPRQEELVPFEVIESTPSSKPESKGNSVVNQCYISPVGSTKARESVTESVTSTISVQSTDSSVFLPISPAGSVQSPARSVSTREGAAGPARGITPSREGLGGSSRGSTPAKDSQGQERMLSPRGQSHERVLSPRGSTTTTPSKEYSGHVVHEAQVHSSTLLDQLKLRTRSRRDLEEEKQQQVVIEDDSGGDYVKLSQTSSKSGTASSTPIKKVVYDCGDGRANRAAFSASPSGGPKVGHISQNSSKPGHVTTDQQSRSAQFADSSARSTSLRLGHSIEVTGVASSRSPGQQQGHVTSESTGSKQQRSGSYSSGWSGVSNTAASGQSGRSVAYSAGDSHRIIKPVILESHGCRKQSEPQLPLVHHHIAQQYHSQRHNNRPGQLTNPTAEMSARTAQGMISGGHHQHQHSSSSGSSQQSSHTSLTPASARMPKAAIEAAGAIFDRAEYNDTSDDEEYGVLEV